jgi:hypothetical protein
MMREVMSFSDYSFQPEIRNFLLILLIAVHVCVYVHVPLH